MNKFDLISEKLGIRKPAAAAKTAPLAPSQAKSEGKFRESGGTSEAGPDAMPMVDVVKKLDDLARKSPIELNWKMSINDLMALLGMDHKPEDIRELAVELSCPASEMDDSYKRNVWTHKALLKKIAENGGNIPQDLLD